MVDVLKEGPHTGEFIVSEANGNRSRDTGTLAKGSNASAGTVLGQSTATGKFEPLNPGSSAGYENAAAILYDNVDATDNDKVVTLFNRDVEVKQALLIFPDDITDEQKAAAIGQLQALGIKLR